MLYEIVGSFAYFVLSIVILAVGFAVLDLLTPGNLRQLVFVEHRPNAAIISAAQQIALGIVIVSAILHSEIELLAGLTDVAIFAGLGIVFQALALVILEAIIPGKFRDLVAADKPEAGVMVAAVTIIVVSAINAACLT